MRIIILLLMLHSVHPLLIPEDKLQRQKRFIDLKGAWKTLFDRFPPTIQDVQRNAEIRMDAELNNIKPIEYAQPALPMADPYQTNFNPGDQVLYMSMSTTPMAENGPIVTETLPHGFKQDQYGSSTKHKRSADVQSYDPSQRLSILGKDPRASSTHYKKVDKSTPGATVSIEKQGVHPKSKVSRRSVQEELELSDPKLTEKILDESSSAQEALVKMLDAEKKIDKVLHKVLGDVHVSDNKDVAKIEKMLGKTLVKRSTEQKIEGVVQDSVKSIETAAKMLTEKDLEEKALEEIIKADREITAMLELMLPREDVEKSVESRVKRDNRISYYDPEFLWLMENLNMRPEEGQQLRNIVYGESSVSPSDSRSYYSGGQDILPPTPYGSSQYGSQPWVPYENQGRQNKMEEKSAWHKLLDTFRPLAEAVPPEFDAAYLGALDVGKHVTKKVRPYVSHSYNKVTKEILPQASHSVSEAIGDDIKDFARQGRKIVESRARYASQAAEPHLQNLKNDLWLLQAQLKQVADETSEYTKKEIVPNIGPAIQGLLFDVQETLELASQMVETDLKPLVKKVSDSVIKPAYSTVSSSVVSPAASTVNDYLVRPVTDTVVRPVAETVVDYVVKPVTQTAQPVVEYAAPVYRTAQGLASSGIEGARVTYHNVRPTIEDLTVSTKKVLHDNVAPTVQIAASQVADGASRIGSVIQSDVVPQVQQGISTTLNGLFTGIPSLVKQVSSEANDAAKIFSNRYRQALEELRSKAEVQRKEQEAKLNMVHKEMLQLQDAQYPAKVKQQIDIQHKMKLQKEMDILNKMKAEEEVAMKKEMEKEYDAIVKAVIEEGDSSKKDKLTQVFTEKIAEPVETTTPKEL